MARRLAVRSLFVFVTIVVGLVLLRQTTRSVSERPLPIHPATVSERPQPLHPATVSERSQPLHPATANVTRLFRKSQWTNRSSTFIPRIIHQTWSGDAIPTQFSPWVRSWMDQNPNWQYWFWTDKDIRCFIARHFADYLSLYDRYIYNINRADVMRYFVLYEHGGLYADIDMECVKPLDDITEGHACLLTEENHAHNYVVNRRYPPACVINCLMASRAKHPFFGEVIKELPVQKKKGSDGDVLTQTGPFLLDRVLRKFLTTQRPSQDRVTVVPPVYFSQTFDPMQLPYLKKTCANTTGLREDARRLCEELVARRFENTLLPTSIADHHWLHTYWDKAGYSRKTQTGIADVALAVAERYHAASTVNSNPDDNCHTPLLKFGPFL